jgi:hypothetical protein
LLHQIEFHIGYSKKYAGVRHKPLVLSPGERGDCFDEKYNRISDL